MNMTTAENCRSLAIPIVIPYTITLLLAFWADLVGAQSVAISGAQVSNLKVIRTPAIHDVSYATLVELMTANKLIVSDKYRLVDFRTRYTIPECNDIHTGELEILLVTANSQNSIDMVAVSEKYPNDIIHYTTNNKLLFHHHSLLESGPDMAVDRGYIMYRKDTIKNIEAGEDFRNMVFRRWETEPGNGVYANTDPYHAPDGARYRDLPMFADYSVASEVHIDHHRTNRGDASDGNFLSNVVFMGYTYKVEMLDGAQNGTFLGSVIELSMKFCSKGIFHGNIERVVLGTSSELTATGDLYSVYINKAEMFLDGKFSNVEILANYNQDIISGDYSNRVFGAKTENTFYLAPQNSIDSGGNKDNPYVIGSNNEDILIVDPLYSNGEAFILVNYPSKIRNIKIASKGMTYIAFDGVEYSGNAFPLENFNNLQGVTLEKGKTLTLDASTGTWSTESAEATFNNTGQRGDIVNSVLTSVDEKLLPIHKELSHLEMLQKSANTRMRELQSRLDDTETQLTPLTSQEFQRHKIVGDSVEAEAVGIRVAKTGDKSIGRFAICPPEVETDGQGYCTIYQNDADHDGLDDITGNPMSDGMRAIVTTSVVNETSRIFLTPRAAVETPLAVTTIEPGQYFTVEVGKTVSGELPFDWWVITEL